MSVLRYLTIPEDQPLLIAIGRVAVAEAQLDYVLKLTLAVLEDRDRSEALRDKEWLGARKIRRRIVKLVEKRLGNNDAARKTKALLENADRASEKHKEYIHNVFGPGDEAQHWTHTENGKPFVIPSVAELNDLTEKIQLVLKEINTALRKGWLVEALERNLRKKSKGKKNKDNRVKKSETTSKKAAGKKSKSKTSADDQHDVKADLRAKSKDKKPGGKNSRKVKESGKGDRPDGTVAAVTNAAADHSAPLVTNGSGGELPLTEAVLKQVVVDEGSGQPSDKDT